MADETRDIVIETRADLRNLQGKIENFIEETRQSHAQIQETLASHEALVNKSKGAWFGLGVLGLISGWVGSHMPGLNKIFF